MQSYPAAVLEESIVTRYVTQRVILNVTVPSMSHDLSSDFHFWRKVVDIPDKASYFSAYAVRSQNLRMFGAIAKGIKDNLYCCFLSSKFPNSANGSDGAKYGMLPENKGCRLVYIMFIFTCDNDDESRFSSCSTRSVRPSVMLRCCFICVICN